MKSTSPEAPETGPHPKITSGDLKVTSISSRAISGGLGITSGHLPATIPRPPEMPEMTRDEIDVARGARDGSAPVVAALSEGDNHRP